MPLDFFVGTAFFLALAVLIIAAFTDLKQRIVPNKLVLFGIVLGLLLHGIEALVGLDYWLLLVPVVIGALTFLFGYLLWKLGVWAGGDVKLFTTIAVLLPYNPAFFSQLLNFPPILQPANMPIFPLTLFIFSVLAMLPFGVLIAVRGIVGSKKLKKDFAQYAKKYAAYAVFLSLAITGTEAMLSFFGLSLLLVLPMLIIMALLPKKIFWALSVLLFLGALCLKLFGAVYEFAGVFAALYFVALGLRLFDVSRKQVLVEGKKISHLQEGDILAETIVQNKGGIERVKALGFAETLKYLKENKLKQLSMRLRPQGKIIASHRSAAGLTIKQLKEIRGLWRKRKLKGVVRVKLSAALVPAVLLGFLVLMLVGDLLWFLVIG